MIILGAGGHAREILTECSWLGIAEDLVFFDETGLPGRIVHGFSILSDAQDAYAHLKTDNRFVLGVGSPALRKQFFERFVGKGGDPYSIISGNAQIGAYGVQLGRGLNIMSGAIITSDIKIGDGCLIHMHASIHHDCIIGDFSEISPGVKILGRVKIGQGVSIGSGAVILPGVSVGDRAIIGAGSVVTKDVEAGATAVGVPAIPLIK